MRPNRRLALAFAISIAAASIAGFLYLSWLWCSVANFADTQLRPAATVGSFVPPPGPIYLESDSYYWLSYAQRIARGEDWRIRHTQMDNFPSGREVHWSQLVSWVMVLFGKTRAIWTHETLSIAVERASVAINPLLYVLAAAGLFLALARQFGALPSALLVAFLGSLGDVEWTFQALRPGHQGFHVVFGAVSVIGLVFGGMGLIGRQRDTPGSGTLFRELHPIDLRTARRWFVLAGVATGLALWVSATIESFFIYPMMGTFIVLLLLMPRRKVLDAGLSVQPDLWRLWGVTAGATGFLFYLIEYFPRHLAMRIEVNHPIYDLAVVGCGEALRLLTRLRWEGRPASATRIVATALALIISALPVGCVLFGPITWHHLRDPQMLRLHNFIQEFYSYNNLVTTNRLGHFYDLFGIVPFISLLAPLLLVRRSLSVPQVTWLWCTFAFACSFLVVAYLQVRWLGFYAAAACLSALVAGHTAYRLIPNAHWMRSDAAAVALVLLLLIQPAESFRSQLTKLRNDLRGVAIESEVINPILIKRLAYALKDSPDRPRAVIADPGLAPALGYFAGIPCLTSFYWENLDGLHDAVRFFATKNPSEAHEIAMKTGATHVIIFPDGRLTNYFYFVAYGHYDTIDATHTFAAKLLHGTAPFWIQPDTVLNFVTTRRYSYRGLPLETHFEAFHIQD